MTWNARTKDDDMDDMECWDKGWCGMSLASYPGLQIVGGRPGIHCLRMRLISPDISVFFRETMMSNDVYVYIPRRTATNDE